MTGDSSIVAQVKDQLVSAGVSLSGACGAFRITNSVALRLAPRYGLLRKIAGNRAVPQFDGSCLNGDQSNQPGFATDYLIDRETGFGYDILGDGGGANNPQWIGPENDPVMVNRNRTNFAEPIPYPPVPPVPPIPVPDPVFTGDVAALYAAIMERFDRLESMIKNPPT